VPGAVKVQSDWQLARGDSKFRRPDILSFDRLIKDGRRQVQGSLVIPGRIDRRNEPVHRARKRQRRRQRRVREIPAIIRLSVDSESAAQVHPKVPNVQLQFLRQREVHLPSLFWGRQEVSGAF
jgi:predicted metalloprotease